MAENYRNQNRSRKPLKLIVLVEGATEEVLLPLFSSVAGIDFEKTGIELVASGGKNQVARIYAEINLGVNLPIFIILESLFKIIGSFVQAHPNLSPDIA